MEEWPNDIVGCWLLLLFSHHLLLHLMCYSVEVLVIGSEQTGGQDYNLRNRIVATISIFLSAAVLSVPASATRHPLCHCPLISETYYCLFAVYILLFISQFDYRLWGCVLASISSIPGLFAWLCV